MSVKMCGTQWWALCPTVTWKEAYSRAVARSSPRARGAVNLKSDTFRQDPSQKVDMNIITSAMEVMFLVYVSRKIPLDFGAYWTEVLKCVQLVQIQIQIWIWLI